MDYKILMQLWAILDRKQRRRAANLLILMLVAMTLESLSIGVIFPIVDFALSPIRDKDNNIPGVSLIIDSIGQKDTVFLGLGILVLLFFIKGLALALVYFRQTKFAFELTYDLSTKLFEVYLSQPWSFHLKRNSAQLTRNLTSETTLFTNVVLAITSVITESLISMGIIVVMFALEPVGSAILITTLSCSAILFYLFFKSALSRWGGERQIYEGERIKAINHTLGAFKEISILGVEASFSEDYRNIAERSIRAQQRSSFVQQLPRIWLEVMAVVAISFSAVVLTVMDKSLQNIIATLGLYAAAAFRVIPSVSRILIASQVVRYHGAVVRTLWEEIRLSSLTNKIEHVTAEGKSNFSKIELEDIFYSYDGSGRPALQGVSVKIERGQTIGIVGQSGSGKSTLVDVLLGLLIPTSGRVALDGETLLLSKVSRKKLFGYVPQNIYLIDDTLERNIAFGESEAEIDAVALARAVRMSNLQRVVDALPAGLKTIVGERGVKLSGGERQRIGIARALYTDPSILIFDEATSALDQENESLVMDAISSLRGEKTQVIVAHRVSTLSACDLILVMENGKVACLKTYDDLVTEA